jgi:hypothetical protein
MSGRWRTRHAPEGKRSAHWIDARARWMTMHGQLDAESTALTRDPRRAAAHSPFVDVVKGRDADRPRSVESTLDAFARRRSSLRVK